MMWGVKIGSVKTGRIRIGARHAWLDKQIRPRALRPVQVHLLSVIAGMARWTLIKRSGNAETASPLGIN